MTKPWVLITLCIVVVVAIAMVVYSGGRTAGAVLQCDQPTSLTETTGLQLSIGMSVQEADTELASTIGKKVEAEFAEASPDSWMSIARSYQYQSCQFLNTIGCGDMGSRECMETKQRILTETYETIRRQLDVQEQSKIEACVSRKASEYQVPMEKTVTGGARAASPGIGGGRNTAREEVCASVGPEFEILEARTEEISCHGGRCSVTAPEISSDRQSVCVTATAWSESRSYGGGGSGQYRLIVSYKKVLTPAQEKMFRAECAGEG